MFNFESIPRKIIENTEYSKAITYLNRNLTDKVTEILKKPSFFEKRVGLEKLQEKISKNILLIRDNKDLKTKLEQINSDLLLIESEDEIRPLLQLKETLNKAINDSEQTLAKGQSIFKQVLMTTKSLKDSLEEPEITIANQTLWKILSKLPPVQGKEEIVITGQVLGDGRGDWAAMKNMHKYLQKIFSDRTVRIIASSAERWHGKLDTTHISALDLTYFGNDEKVGENVPLSAFPKESNIIEKVKKAGMIISAGVGIEGLYESIKDEIKDKSIKINEHDMGTESRSEGFISTTLQTGIDPAKDRVGIFVKSNKKDYNWNDLSNENLKSVLFEKDTPINYLSNHQCFFGYMTYGENKIKFIKDIISFSNLDSPKKSIDVCIPGFESDIKDSKFESFIKLGIGKVHLIWFQDHERKERTIELGKGKELRIIDPGILSNKDFKIMTSISAPIVGCTGDNSLAQTLSFGKIPYYERRFPSKARALLRRIETNFGKDSSLYKYCLKYSLENINLPELVEQAKQLGKFMRDEGAFQPVLKGVVNEKLLRQKNKNFAHKEDRLLQDYLAKKISLDDLTHQFKVLLSNEGLS